MLAKGEADAGFLVLAPEARTIQRLLRTPNVGLMSFANAEAYTQRFPFLSRLVLRQGVVDFAANIPPADTTLIATTAAVLVRADAHSALVNLLAQAAAGGARPADGRRERRGAAVSARRRVPDGQRSRVRLVGGRAPRLSLGRAVAAALHAVLGRHHARPPDGVVRGAAADPDPAARFAPQIYNWRIRRRIMYWYGELKRLEAAARRASTREERAAKLAELDRIEAAVDNIAVPLGFADRLYELRQHVELTRRRLTAGTASQPAAA